MTAEEVRKLNVLSRQLTENLMSAALCAREISAIAHGQEDGGSDGDLKRDRSGRALDEQEKQRPFLEEATLSVTWRGKSLHLGHTQGFWLLSLLARRPNRYVTHLDLMREIWDDEFADTALLRSGVRRLRSKLRQGGMADLANAITGHHGRYMLDLSAMPRHADVTAPCHRTSQI
jgi:DNA-binding response OmpR family regulator